MSFELPPLRPQHEIKKNIQIGKADGESLLTAKPGLKPIKSSLEAHHPLQLSELNSMKNEERLRMTVLRNVQGLHAPLRLAAELRATESIGRLPFLESSNLSRDTLKGQDDLISFTDILSVPAMDERMINPHRFMEAQLGIL